MVKRVGRPPTTQPPKAARKIGELRSSFCKTRESREQSAQTRNRFTRGNDEALALRGPFSERKSKGNKDETNQELSNCYGRGSFSNDVGVSESAGCQVQLHG